MGVAFIKIVNSRIPTNPDQFNLGIDSVATTWFKIGVISKYIRAKLGLIARNLNC
jgi:hypothetical protein